MENGNFFQDQLVQAVGQRINVYLEQSNNSMHGKLVCAKNDYIILEEDTVLPNNTKPTTYTKAVLRRTMRMSLVTSFYIVYPVEEPSQPPSGGVYR